MGLYDNLGDKLFYTRGILHMFVPRAWRKVQIFNVRQSYTADRRYLANRKTAEIYRVIVQ